MDTKKVELTDGEYYMVIGILGHLVNDGELKVSSDVRPKIAETLKKLWVSS